MATPKKIDIEELLNQLPPSIRIKGGYNYRLFIHRNENEWACGYILLCAIEPHDKLHVEKNEDLKISLINLLDWVAEYMKKDARE